MGYLLKNSLITCVAGAFRKLLNSLKLVMSECIPILSLCLALRRAASMIARPTKSFVLQIFVNLVLVVVGLARSPRPSTLSTLFHALCRRTSAALLKFFLDEELKVLQPPLSDR